MTEVKNDIACFLIIIEDRNKLLMPPLEFVGTIEYIRQKIWELSQKGQYKLYVRSQGMTYDLLEYGLIKKDLLFEPIYLYKN
jgi:hypothetical protein